MDALVDLPFALPTSVAGITLTSLYAQNGWIGRLFRAVRNKSRLHAARSWWRLRLSACPSWCGRFSRCCRTSRPNWRKPRRRLGATRDCRPFRRVIAPALLPAVLTGFALAFARALGEYGSVVFISGNMPMHTEVVPLLIMTKLEQFDYQGATAIALVMLVISFTMLFVINLLQRWSARRVAVEASTERSPVEWRRLALPLHDATRDLRRATTIRPGRAG